MKNIIFFHQHHGGLGSQTRFLSIAKATKKLNPKANVVIIAGNDYAPLAKNTLYGIEILYIPRVEQGSHNGILFKKKRVKNLEYSEEKVFEIRHHIISTLLDCFPPSILVLDQFPLGRRGFSEEIRAVISKACTINPSCKIIASVKDIFGQIKKKGTIWTSYISKDAISELCEFINIVVYHSDPKIITHDECIRLGQVKLSKRIPDFLYTGYIKNTVELAGMNCDFRRWDIVVSFGSGLDALPGLKVLAKAMTLIQDLSFSCLIVLGHQCPEIPQEIMGKISGFTIVPLVNSLSDVIKTARIAIMMGGSSIIDAISVGVKAIYMPRIEIEDTDEQVFRAERFSAAGCGSTILINKDDAAIQLSELIRSSLVSEKNKILPYIETRGALKTGKIISQLLRNNMNIPSTYVSLPHKAQIEICRTCNLKCPVCPVGNGKARKFPNMELFLFSRVIDEISPFITFLKLYNYGEPLLHPRIIKFVKYAKEAGIETVEITTNGTIMSKKLASELVSSGLDILRFSIDGTNQQEYELYRKYSKLSVVLENVNAVLRSRINTNSKTPKVELQMIAMKHNEESLIRYKQMAKELGADSVRIKTFNAYMSGIDGVKEGQKYLPNIKGMSRYIFHDNKLTVRPEYKLKVCKWPWENLVINSNGEIVPCCYDYNGTHCLGNINEGGFSDWWDTPKRREFRRRMVNSINNIEMCNHCAYGVPDLSVRFK